MPVSQNGWPARRDLPLRKLVINDVGFLPGILDDDDVATVLGYVAQQFNDRVEKLVNPGCWGFNYRENRNGSDLSNHSSATAIDVNAPAHPNGVPTWKTFTPGQVAEVHRILHEVDRVVRWGGDYTRTPDAMHFEINRPRADVARVAARLRAPEDDMPYSEADLERIIAKVIDVKTPAIVQAVVDYPLGNGMTFGNNVRRGGDAKTLAQEIRKELSEHTDPPVEAKK